MGGLFKQMYADYLQMIRIVWFERCGPSNYKSFEFNMSIISSRGHARSAKAHDFTQFDDVESCIELTGFTQLKNEETIM